MGKKTRFLQEFCFVMMLLIINFTVSSCGSSGGDPKADSNDLTADTVYSNGIVLTVDESFSIAEAVAVKDGKILVVGTNDDMQAYIGNNTTTIDLHGSTLMPGMNDAHNHLGGFGIERPPFKLNLNYPNIASIADVVEQVAAAVAVVSPSAWIQGNGWDEGFLDEVLADPNRHPTKEDLDAVSPSNPVALADFSHHVLWVNSVALTMAGITADTPDPSDGIIVRDAQGQPTGLLLEKATYLVSQLIPPWNPEQWKAGMLAAYAEMNSLGYTSVTDPGISISAVDLYKEIRDEGNASLRLNVLISLSGGGDSIELQKTLIYAAKALSQSNDEWVRVAGMKGLGDGIPPSRTAWLTEEYLEGGNGALFGVGDTEAEKMAYWNEIVAFANELELQVGVHSTGDATMRTLVNAYATALDTHSWDARHYIIHGDFILPETMAIMGAYNLGINVQSAIKWTISDYMNTVVGEDRSAKQWSLQSMIDNGIIVSNSSDATVTYPDWRIGIASAMLRESKATGNVSGPEEVISVQDALRSYTINGAWQDHQEDIKGSIEVGKVADFCIIDQNLLSLDPHIIPEVKIWMTVCNDVIVYRNPAGPFAQP